MISIGRSSTRGEQLGSSTWLLAVAVGAWIRASSSRQRARSTWRLGFAFSRFGRLGSRRCHRHLGIHEEIADARRSAHMVDQTGQLAKNASRHAATPAAAATIVAIGRASLLLPRASYNKECEKDAPVPPGSLAWSCRGDGHNAYRGVCFMARQLGENSTRAAARSHG